MIFDFDGTLVDSARCITTSVERALNDCGCACDVSRVREQIGLPLDAIIREASAGITEAAIARVIASYREHYARLEEELIVLFPGARETLDELHGSAVRLAIATNKLTARAESALVRLGVASRFDAIVGADRAARPKPHPDILQEVLVATACRASDALMVGDTVWDIEMARRAGVASCAVTWGNHDAGRLALAGPSHMVSSFLELRNLIQSMPADAKRN